MNLTAILSPVIAIGGIGLFFGMILGFAAKKFAVPVDERVEEVKACLPGANCGGCGMAGCEAMAKSIVSGESKVDACPVCNNEQVAAIAKVMGVESTEGEKKVAIVRCRGNKDTAKTKFEYTGLQSCEDAALIGGGPKLCSYGCLGFGSCQKTCQFGAITMQDGLPVIDKEQCVACGACASACPRNVIEIMPARASFMVSCVSHDKGKDVKAACKVGCIGCGLCMKQCEEGAITVVNSVAHIDQSKCISCGKCFAKCPTKAIMALVGAAAEEKTEAEAAITK